jgi:hypothetical protein
MIELRRVNRLKTHQGLLMKRILRTAVLATLSVSAFAQSSSINPRQKQDEKGFTSSMSFDGSVNSQERILDLDSKVGYNFSSHWGLDLGVPLSFDSSSSTTTTTTPAPGKSGGGSASSSTSTSNSSNGIGNVYSELRFMQNAKAANFASTITAGAPTGSTSKGISTGRAALSWNNHVEHEFDRLTPFVEGGFSNGVMDTQFFRHPFTSLGFTSQFSGGTTVDIGHNFTVGGSFYDVLPSGQQKVFSKLVGKGSGKNAGSGSHGRSWELAAETVGSSALTRDNGGSGWVGFSSGEILDFQIGYTHSVRYALDTMAFNVGVNLRKVKKRSQSH